MVAGWVGGANRVAFSLPPTVRDSFGGFAPPNEPPTVASGMGFPDDDLPGIQLPGINRAVERLESRRIVRPDEFRTLSASAKQQAFTISSDLSDDSIGEIRDLLTETIREGYDRETFERMAEERIDKLPISRSHLEQVYRNTVNESLSQGMEHVLDQPLVANAFPYRLYVPIRDARARHEHLALETLGLNGTGVYWKDDPTWLRFRPPWDYNCRCGWVAISIKAAARLGVREAQEWFESDEEPIHQLVAPPPFSPPAGWDRLTLAT